MKWNVLTSEAEPQATSVPESEVSGHESQDSGQESLASRSETSVPTGDSIIEQVRRDATMDSVKYLIRSDVGHDGE